MALTRAHLEDVCDINSEPCIFLKYMRSDGCHVCLKMHKKSRDKILDTVSKGMQNGAIDPSKVKDNCSGYPLLKHIPQGYDVSAP